ncbi:YhcB family protein [Paracoccaceae bacterium]|nr:YhcB family protein [Paracoccaceae bacterium]
MKLWRYIFGVFLLTLCTLFALANDDMVMVRLPNILETVSGKSIYLPIYLLTSLAIFVGVIIGVLIEYLRNSKLRKSFYENNKKLLKIEKELQKNKEKFLTEEEKIFNLLD